MIAANGGSAEGYDARKTEAGLREETESFVDDGVEIGERLCGAEGELGSGDACRCEFCAEARESGWVAGQVVVGPGESGAGCVGARGDVGAETHGDVGVGEVGRVAFVDVEEFVEDAGGGIGVCGFLGQSVVVVGIGRSAVLSSFEGGFRGEVVEVHFAASFGFGLFCDEAFHGNEGRVEVRIKAHESSIGECGVDGLGQLADVFAMIEEAESFTIGHDADGVECHTGDLP